MPFETVYGISLRRFPQAAEYERAKIIPNLGLFGPPVREGTVTARGINRMVVDSCSPKNQGNRNDAGAAIGRAAVSLVSRLTAVPRPGGRLCRNCGKDRA